MLLDPKHPPNINNHQPVMISILINLLDRNPGPGYDTQPLQLIPGDLLSKCPVDSFTHYPAFKTVGLHCQTPTLKPACQGGTQFGTIFMLVFGITRPEIEPATYRMRDGHANH